MLELESGRGVIIELIVIAVITDGSRTLRMSFQIRLVLFLEECVLLGNSRGNRRRCLGGSTHGTENQKSDQCGIAHVLKRHCGSGHVTSRQRGKPAIYRYRVHRAG